ncbi:MAG: amidohydrolase family protein [Bacteroidetes bacterium]|nr:amidohydrolase family protein [Bacteroidota bacterium]
MRFLTADLIFPVYTSPLRGGIIVLSDDGEILDVLDQGKLDYEISSMEYFPGLLCPGFINSHCHLELSWCKGLVPEGNGLDNFLRSIDSIRKPVNEEQELSAILEWGKSMYENGIVAVGDISNRLVSAVFKQQSPILFHNFIEVFSSDPLRAEKAFERVSVVCDAFRKLSRNNRASITPHATYSLSKELFRLVADNSAGKVFPLSIHHQESDEENRFFMDGSSTLSERRKLFNPDIAPFSPTGKRPIESIAGYFRRDQSMILVHNTYSKVEDIKFAENFFSNLSWCLCPNANLYIESRLPEIDLLRKYGSRIILGTDSLASNHSLSILDEIHTIQQNFPGIPFCEILGWATLNGAEALGFEQLGSLEAGKKPGIVHIDGIDQENPKILPSSKPTLIAKAGQ